MNIPVLGGPKPTNNTRTVKLSMPSGMPQLNGQAAFLLRKLEGEEELSKLYHYKLEVITPDDPAIYSSDAANIDSQKLLGKQLNVAVDLGNGAKRELGGEITKAQFVSLNDKRAIYELELKPWLDMADQGQDYKVFQNRTVVEIIELVLFPYGRILIKDTQRAYPKLGYCLQFGESDFAFAARLMESWGIYFYFNHQGGRHDLVITDAISRHKPIKGCEFLDYQVFTQNPLNKANEVIDTFSLVYAKRAAGQAINIDYDFTKPTQAITAKTEVTNGQSQYDDYRHYNGKVDQGHNPLRHVSWGDSTLLPTQNGSAAASDDLNWRATARAEAMACRQNVGSGKGSLAGLVCGHTFTLRGHIQNKANQEYLVVMSKLTVTESEQRADAKQPGFSCEFEVELCPTSLPWRSSVGYKAPVISGSVNAVVVGQPGYQVWTDEYGRILTQFYWDRHGSKDLNSSCWMRVVSPLAGDQFGMQHIPRVGQEVAVVFENGNPDRPFVIGCLYNGANKPVNLPSAQYISGFYSRSIGGGYDHGSHFIFNDKQGAELVSLHAEKDLSTTVEQTAKYEYGNQGSLLGKIASGISNGLSQVVKLATFGLVDGATKTESVGGASLLSVAGVYGINVLGAQVNSVEGERTDSTLGHHTDYVMGYRDNSVAKHLSEYVGDNHTDQVQGSRNTTIHKDLGLAVGGDRRDAVGGLHEVMINGLWNMTVLKGAYLRIKENYLVKIKGNHETKVDGNSQMVIAKDHTETIKGTSTTAIGEKINIVADADSWTLTVGKAKLVLKADGTVSVNGKDVSLIAEGELLTEGEKKQWKS